MTRCYCFQIWLFLPIWPPLHIIQGIPLGWEIICTNVLIPIYCFVVFILILREPQGNAVEVWVTSYSLHYLIWKYPERTSANEGILRSVLLSKKQWIIRRNIYASGGNLLQKLKGVSLKKSFFISCVGRWNN